MSSHYLRLHLELLQNKNNFKITETISKIIRLFLKKLFKNQTKIKTLFQIYLKSKIILKQKPWLTKWTNKMKHCWQLTWMFQDKNIQLRN